jgi:hypothetical protein
LPTAEGFSERDVHLGLIRPRKLRPKVHGHAQLDAEELEQAYLAAQEALLFVSVGRLEVGQQSIQVVAVVGIPVSQPQLA